MQDSVHQPYFGAPYYAYSIWNPRANSIKAPIVVLLGLRGRVIVYYKPQIRVEVLRPHIMLDAAGLNFRGSKCLEDKAPS